MAPITPPPPLHPDPAKPTGARSIFHNPAQALNEIASYRPIAETDALAKERALAFVTNHRNEFCAKRNWHGHLVGGALVLDHTRTGVWVYHRAQPATCGLMDAHFEVPDRTLFEGSLRGAAAKLRVKHKALTPLSSAPLFIHSDPYAARGQQKPHGHHVITFGFVLNQETIETPTTAERPERLGFLAAYERLTNYHPAAPILSYIIKKLG